MTGAVATKPEVIRRIVHYANVRRGATSVGSRGVREFRAGERVRSIRVVKNDGMYPHRDVGEALVQSGDAGIVRESWCFLGEIYYTVEFVSRAVVVIMRGREMVRSRWDMGVRP